MTPTAMPWDGLIAAHQDPAQPWSLNGLAAQVSTWHARELPGKPNIMLRVGKVAEEAGEAIGAVIKLAETRMGQRTHPPASVRQEDAEAELADVVIAAIGAFEGIGVTDIDAVVAKRWAEVGARRFASHGHAAP